MKSINRKFWPKIIRIVILPILILTFYTSAYAQATLRVRVVDPKGAVVTGATLEAHEEDCLCSQCSADQKPCKCCIDQVSVSDDNGEVSFKLRAGTYSIKVTATGWQTVQQNNVKISGGGNFIEIKLEPASGGSDTVVFSRTKFTTSGQKETRTSGQERERRETSFEGRITDERNKPVKNAVLELRDRGCLCSSCSEDKKPCKCCIDQRTVTDRDGAYMIKAERGKLYDLRVKEANKAAGTFSGIGVDSRERNTRLDMRIERASERMNNRDREKPERVSPEKERPGKEASDKERPEKERPEKERPERARP